MNCQDFEATVADVARGHRMDAALQEAGMAHAATCAACASLLAEQRMLNAGFRALAANSAAEQAAPGLEASLRSAFRAHSALPAPSPARPRWYWALVAAACLVLAVAAAGRLRQTARVSGPPSQPAPPVVQRTPGTALASAQPPAQRLVPRRRVQPAPVHHTRRPPARVEPDEEFVPLLYGAAPAPFDSGQVVRVKLPPSALVAFGLPVNANRADSVQADVLFAEDGMARAIRFVK